MIYASSRAVWCPDACSENSAHPRKSSSSTTTDNCPLTPQTLAAATVAFHCQKLPLARDPARWVPYTCSLTRHSQSWSPSTLQIGPGTSSSKYSLQSYHLSPTFLTLTSSAPSSGSPTRFDSAHRGICDRSHSFPCLLLNAATLATDHMSLSNCVPAATLYFASSTSQLAYPC